MFGVFINRKPGLRLDLAYLEGYLNDTTDA